MKLPATVDEDGTCNDQQTMSHGRDPSASSSANPQSEEYQRWLSRVKADYYCLDNAPDRLLGDKNFMLASVQQEGYALKYATKNDLQNDRSVVMAAVQHNGLALKYSSPEFKNDRDIVLAAVRQNGSALRYSTPKLRSDKTIVLAAVQQNGYILLDVTPDLQKDKDVVIASLKQNPDNIKYAHNDIKHDPEVLIAAGMFDEHHKDATTRQKNTNDAAQMIKRIVLSTRFSLDRRSRSDATNFTKLLKENEYIQNGGFQVYAPNAFDKETCDPNWTNFDWPCRGTTNTCQMEDESLRNGPPTNRSCWRYSFRNQLHEAKHTGGFMLQLVEKGSELNLDGPTLGKGQQIELDMATNHLKMKTFQVYRPTSRYGGEYPFEKRDIDAVVAAIKDWYDEGCQDWSEYVVRPETIQSPWPI